MNNFKQWLAGWLCFLACKLRGHQWRQLSYNYPGVFGNHPADLKDRLWQLIVLANSPKPTTDYLEDIESMLDELGQIAGEAWGHHPQPKETTK